MATRPPPVRKHCFTKAIADGELLCNFLPKVTQDHFLILPTLSRQLTAFIFSIAEDVFYNMDDIFVTRF